NRLDVETHHQSQQESDHGADDTDRSTRNHEHPHDTALGDPHGAQYADIAALVFHQHDQARGDVERGHDYDDGEDQEHDVALDLQRIEEGRIALTPVDHEDRPVGGVGDELAIAVDLVRLVDINFDSGHVAGPIEVGLRFRQRHEHERGI